MVARHSASTAFDTIVVGSGINGLVCAVMLARAGQRVLVLERSAKPGGCVDTAEATLPGFRHDLMAMSWPLFVTAPYFGPWENELREAGVTFRTVSTPTGSLLPDGRSIVLTRSREANRARLNAVHPGDGDAYARALAEVEAHADLIFGLLGGAPDARAAAGVLLRGWRRLGGAGLRAACAGTLAPMRGWLERGFGSELTRALLAPWILHAGQSPDDPMSAVVGKAITASIEAAGVPVVEGGGDVLVQALLRMLTRRGGALRCDADVAAIVTRHGRAVAVRLADGRTVAARRIVCDVTPTQLYGRLLPQLPAPHPARSQAAAYRYGRAGMQIHLALDAPPRWRDPALGEVGLLHVTSGLDGVSQAVSEAQRGLLPAMGTIAVGQPAAADPTRCPPGRSLLWIQLQELPSRPRGDAAGQLDTGDGTWTPHLAEAYADRIVARLETHIPGLSGQILARAVLSPADLARRNVNLVGGDPYSGACGLDQFHLARGIAGERNYRTPIGRLWRIGASSHPGPGLGGMSGYLAARQIIGRRAA